MFEFLHYWLTPIPIGVNLVVLVGRVEQSELRKMYRFFVSLNCLLSEPGWTRLEDYQDYVFSRIKVVLVNTKNGIKEKHGYPYQKHLS